MTTSTATQNSTTVRADSRQLTALRTAFAVLDHTAPSLAARWATRIWCTLPSNTGRRRDDRPIPGLFAPPSTTLDVTLEGGRRVVAETWGDGPPVYLVHGWGGWRGQLGALVEPLASRGFQVIAADSPSHGESGPGRLGPRRSHGLEMMESLEATIDAFGPPAGLVGHSLGAAVLAWSIDRGMPAPPRVALIAPTRGPMRYIDGIVDALGIRPRSRAAMLDHLERMLGRPPAGFDTRKVAPHMPPALIVHDRDDKEVPYSEGMEIADAWPDASVLTTHGLGHQRILRDTAVATAVADYLELDVARGSTR